MCTPSARRRARAALVVSAACTLVAGACARTPEPPGDEARALPMAEIRIATSARATASLAVPALPGEPPPSRYASADRPIGWEAMLAREVDAIEAAGGDPRSWPWWAPPAAIGGGPGR